MNQELAKILLVDDEQKFLNSIAERLKLLGFDPIKASSGPQALALAQKAPLIWQSSITKCPAWTDW